MSSTKCRLCLCLVDKQTGFSCSLNDDAFCAMLKIVFPFPISSVHTVANKTYDLPVLVCFLCATTVRNFYNFSQTVSTVQKKLQRECLGKDDNLSIEELLQYIKKEPEMRNDISDANDTESVKMSAHMVSTQSAASEEEIIGLPHSATDPDAPFQEWIGATIGKSIGCMNTNEVINGIVAVERRVKTVVSRLDMLLRQSSKVAQLSNCHDDFEFDLVSSEEECEAFDAKLSEAAYMDKIINWIDDRVKCDDGNRRMFLSIDLIFTRAFLTKCSVTGASHKGEPKIAFRRFQNILKLFRLIGTTHLTLMTDEGVIMFFSTRLRNSRQRMLAKGVRRSSKNYTRLINYKMLQNTNSM
ncbi:uncharacterized protein LOC131281802 [Anopheles ziemanni]|uniref:uncharacterized protein LOC131262128 n=1 Tax=Anopheles coustani TaxID=139045 RepID=UPI00265A5175|nr:uncharacterized protein LOC131262128 [Anopheles coustani]XP_058120038.1 uncharacterized protein LOC131262128 [Anopheles coustani]XP_058167141.1 uncharacterized protein LOC131281802 [Anopheles ziemanni]